MFSLDSFYKIISANLLNPINFTSFYFSRFGSTNFKDLVGTTNDENNKFHSDPIIKVLLFYDQEPIFFKNFVNIVKMPHGDDWSAAWMAFQEFHGEMTFDCRFYYFEEFFKVLANSEISEEKTNILKDFGYSDWYYFFHGFAALDWFRNIKYIPPNYEFTKVFICFNNLYNEKRSYRLNLVARLIDKNLDQFGAISLNPDNLKAKIKQELYSPTSLLSVESKKIVYHNLYLTTPNLVIDTNNYDGTLSAFDDLDVLSQGLFHIVTETIFYDKKLHLTEKIFKPIVARRPFILVGAPGNLKYFKSYGFKTFDKWIDESYDDIDDPDERIIKIVDEIEKLTKLSNKELKQLQIEMSEIVEFNYNHFYGDFKNIIINELVDNFELCLKKFNAGKDRSFLNYFDYSNIDFEKVKNLLQK